MSAERLTLADLVGARIEDAYEEDEVLTLALKDRNGRALHVAVMRDPEGNGPGSVHVFDTETVTFLGILGGR